MKKMKQIILATHFLMAMPLSYASSVPREQVLEKSLVKITARCQVYSCTKSVLQGNDRFKAWYENVPSYGAVAYGKFQVARRFYDVRKNRRGEERIIERSYTPIEKITDVRPIDESNTGCQIRNMAHGAFEDDYYQASDPSEVAHACEQELEKYLDRVDFGEYVGE